jgi:hypothetical protein
MQRCDQNGRRNVGFASTLSAEFDRLPLQGTGGKMPTAVYSLERRPPTMTDPNRSPEYQAFKDRIAEHVEAIHTASRELLESRRTGNDAGSGKLLVAMETVMEPPAVEASDQDHDGRLRIENVCPDGIVPIFVIYDCGDPDPFACRDIYYM